MPGHEIAPKQELVKKPGSRSNRKRPKLVRFLLIMGVTSAMIATGGFGTFPPNELTASLASLISQNFPAEIIESVNLVLEQIAAPTLEVVEHPDSPNADTEIAGLLENLVESIFTAFPTASTEPTAIPDAFIATAENNTPPPENTAKPTAETTGTAMEALSPSPISTPQPSHTVQPNPIVAPLPTWTFVNIPPPPPRTRKPQPTDFPTIAPTLTIPPTSTDTLTPVPAGHLITSLSLDGGGSSVTVAGGSTVTVDYTYQVWGDSSTCPGCNFELVWGLDNAWQTCFAWTSPSPGDYPGQSGTASASGMTIAITAPSTPGTYTIYSFTGQYTDCSSAIAAYTSASGTAVGQITVACGAGLNFIVSANAGDALSLTWLGTSWNTVPNIGLPNRCIISVTNNSATDLPIAFQYADGMCLSYTVPPGGGPTGVDADNLLGQCPLILYGP